MTRGVYGNIPIMITGHSMGGAMASFCALDLVVSNNLYTLVIFLALVVTVTLPCIVCICLVCDTGKQW